MIRDTEDLLITIKSILIKNINKNIDKINLEKNDNLLDYINDNDYYFYLREYPNALNFVHIYPLLDKTNPNRASTAQDLVVLLEICCVDDMTNNSYLRGLRYTRVLKQSIEAQALELGAEIEEVLPAVISTAGKKLVVGGIKLKICFV